MKRLKKPIDEAKGKARVIYDRHASKIALASLIIVMAGVLVGCGIAGAWIGRTTATRRAEQAEKRLTELKEDHANEISRLKAEWEEETKHQVEEAEGRIKFEIIPQIGALVDKLGEEITAYRELSADIDRLLEMCGQLVDNVSENGM